MIDTDNVAHFQHRNELHRHFAPGVIEGHKAPMSTKGAHPFTEKQL